MSQLFAWAEGLYRFETDRLPPAGKITVRVDLENIILDGAHRQQEHEQYQDGIPDSEMALKFIDCSDVNIRDSNLPSFSLDNTPA